MYVVDCFNAATGWLMSFFTSAHRATEDPDRSTSPLRYVMVAMKSVVSALAIGAGGAAAGAWRGTGVTLHLLAAAACDRFRRYEMAIWMYLRT